MSMTHQIIILLACFGLDQLHLVFTHSRQDAVVLRTLPAELDQQQILRILLKFQLHIDLFVVQGVFLLDQPVHFAVLLKQNNTAWTVLFVSMDYVDLAESHQKCRRR